MLFHAKHNEISYLDSTCASFVRLSRKRDYTMNAEFNHLNLLELFRYEVLRSIELNYWVSMLFMITVWAAFDYPNIEHFVSVECRVRGSGVRGKVRDRILGLSATTGKYGSPLITSLSYTVLLSQIIID